MRFLFATGRPHVPDQVGGAARSIHTLLELAAENGHACEAVVGLAHGWRRRLMCGIALLSAGRKTHLRDKLNGYPCYRTPRQMIAGLTRQRITAFRPDILITQLDSAREIAAVGFDKGVATVLNVRDAEFEQKTWPPAHSRLRFVSCSHFVAARLRERLGLESTVVFPVIRMADYRVRDRVPEFITFVNPVPEKGVELALEIAALAPNRRFLFVESWPLGEKARHRLRDGLRQLSNVTFAGWTHDMRTVYSRTALLIVPSQWEEGFGRVALEAQISGIPVIGRDIGGIGEVLRDSGILLPQNAAADAWAQTIERLLSDQSFYAACSAAASINASRPEFNPLHQLDRFLAIATECISK